MGRISKEELTELKKLNAFDYLQATQPDELVREANGEYHTQTHDSLKMQENGVWCWKSRSKGDKGYSGKSALDYLVNVCELDFRTAVEQVQSVIGQIPVSFQSSQKSVAKEKQPFAKPPSDENNLTVLAYLQGRGLDPQLLAMCIRQGVLYQSSYKHHRNCVFLCKDDAGEARAGITRGCGEGRYRRSVIGSNKNYGFCIRSGMPDCKILEVYEAPIDLLSGATLRRRQQGKNWRSVHYLAMGGLDENPVALFVSNHPDINRIVVRTDTDEPGRGFVKKLQERYKSSGIEIVDDPPPRGHDYNDYLRLMLEQSRER